jgi:hypothetical protein
MSGAAKRKHDFVSLYDTDGPQATAWQQDESAMLAASTVDLQAFEACFLNGLDFGLYELVDPILTDTANNNSPDETHGRTAHRGDSATIANVDISVWARRPFVLNDELEAEARRRRLDQPIQIPEKRFGCPLSNEFSLKFRYLTSWHSTP